MERFSIKTVTGGIAKGAGAAGKGIKTGAETAGQKVKDGVLSPIWKFLQKIWGWLKYVCSLVCCCCIASLCVTFQVPQMIASLFEG